MHRKLLFLRAFLTRDDPRRSTRLDSILPRRARHLKGQRRNSVRIPALRPCPLAHPRHRRHVLDPPLQSAPFLGHLRWAPVSRYILTHPTRRAVRYHHTRGGQPLLASAQPDCVHKLRLSPPACASGPSTSWDLMAPSRTGSAPTLDVIDAVTRFMIDALERLRMHLFRQAPITAVVPFVHYSKRQLADPAPPFDILQGAVRRDDRIDCMLSRSIENSYYRVRLATTT